MWQHCFEEYVLELFHSIKMKMFLEISLYIFQPTSQSRNDSYGRDHFVHCFVPKNPFQVLR